MRNLRTLLLINRADMAERGIGEFDLIDITSFLSGVSWSTGDPARWELFGWVCATASCASAAAGH